MCFTFGSAQYSGFLSGQVNDSDEERIEPDGEGIESDVDGIYMSNNGVKSVNQDILIGVMFAARLFLETVNVACEPPPSY